MSRKNSRRCEFKVLPTAAVKLSNNSSPYRQYLKGSDQAWFGETLPGAHNLSHRIANVLDRAGSNQVSILLGNGVNEFQGF